MYILATAQFRYINIQPQTIDLITRLRGINYRVCVVYSPEPPGDVYCFKLNFKTSKFAYYSTSARWIFMRSKIDNEGRSAELAHIQQARVE